ncbi:hypothetical protein AJ80_01180 [Polytolypa hystricis UAMH7299]|uniref:LysM domain-containing protein n=1 Tax=Polytolypa hystricis (strain UAMH7299) TaxID=1447883 RepID=A0A2B7Z1W0_POLH7|nr:hypothetical protein AJ80_01180 [Polytolypa hystricis UAMH7299]
MVGKSNAVLIALLGVSGALAGRAKSRRDETPQFEYDPDTSPYCSWWWDNDGSLLCEDIPSLWGITLEDFLRWNPSVTESCDNYLADHSYCVEAFDEPPPTTTDEPPTTTTTPGAPGPTQPGQIETCNRWDNVESGDSCQTFIDKYPGVTLQKLVEWNSGIGDQCQLLWLDYYICTGVTDWTPSGTITDTPPTATNGIPTPSPTQPGMVENCDAFHKVESGDQCGVIAQQYGISLSQFVEYNPGVNADCSGLWLDYYVCVSIIGVGPDPTITTTTTTTPTNGIPTPTPVQPGMVTNCDEFHKVSSGDTCAMITQTNGISLSQFYSWNPNVGSDCSGIWLDYYVCVSIVGHDPTPTTTQGNGVATPTPIQAGMTTKCDKFHMVGSGDECGTIASNAGISLSDFYAWNAGVGSSCETLWLGYYVCISLL